MEIICENVAQSEIANVFRRTSKDNLHQFTLQGTSDNFKELHLPAHLLAYHKFRFLSISCSDNINSTTIQPKLTIHQDAFALTKNKTEHLYIHHCNLKSLDFAFLNGFDQLHSLNIIYSSDAGSADWGSLPPLPSLQVLNIQDGGNHQNNSFANSFPTLHYGISKLSLIGIGFSGDEMANEILQCIHQSSAETLTHVEFRNWKNLTKIPRRLSSFKMLERLEIICNNFEMPILEENSIVFNVPFYLFSLKNCGIKEIKPGAIQGTGLHYEVKFCIPFRL